MPHLNRALIAGLPAFRDLTASDLDEILRPARSVRFPHDTAIFEQEAEAHAFFLLLDGHVRVTRTMPNGTKIVVRHIGDGELFGIAAALGRDTYPATAMAAVDCVVLVWPNSVWAELSARFPPFRVETYRTVASRLEETQTRVAELSTERVGQRVASALMRLASQSGRPTAEGIEIDFPLSRADIAEMTGTTLYTVSRLLSLWEEEGWVGGGRQRVVVKDRKALLKLAGGLP